MNRARTRRAPSGFAAQTLVFILATIGITAGATVAIIETYQKWIVEPRTPSEVKKLSSENDALKSKVKQLEDQINESDEKVWQEHMLEAAQVIRLTTKETQTGGQPQLSEAIRYRGLLPEEIRLIKLKEATRIVDKALKESPSLLDSVFATHTLEGWRERMPKYVNNLDQRVAAYTEAHSERRVIIDRRIKDATDPARSDERP